MLYGKECNIMPWVLKERVIINKSFYEIREIYYNWNLEVLFYYNMDSDFKIGFRNHQKNHLTVITVKNFLDVFDIKNKRNIDELDDKFIPHKQILTDLMKNFYIRCGGL